MKRCYEVKGVPVSLGLKDVDVKTGTVIAYGASFDVKDDGGDIIMPGAFKKTIQEWGPMGANRITHLYQHSRDLILGKPTMIKEDEFGLLFQSTISKTSWGNDVLVLYEDGVINEHSIGYDTIIEQIDKELNARKLVELRLWDVSSVTWGMNQFTPTVGFKDMNERERYLKEFESINRVLKRNVTDDTAQELELRLRQLKQAFIDLHESLERKPVRATSPENQPKKEMDEIVQIMRSQTDRINKLLKG
jgi:uncharacterized protein